MNVNDLKKKQLAIIEDLNSGNDAKIIQALEAISEYGNAEMLSHLINLFVSNPSKEVLGLLEKVLFNLKDPNVIPALIDLLKSDAHAANRAAIMSVIWQSGLDVSEHVVLFTNIAIAGDYMTAFEALTVIDSQEVFQEEQLQESIKMLDKALERKGEIQTLLVNLRQIMLDKLLG